MYERTGHRDRASREELVERITRVNRVGGIVEPIPGLHLNRVSRASERLHSVSMPSFCVVAQGSKEVSLGERSYRYDTEHYLLTTVELPITSCVVEASEERPYLSARVDLDPALVGSVMVEAGVPAPRSQTDAKAVVVSPLDADLLDAMLRLVRLIDSPAEARVLAPLVKREIVFRLLLGEQGNRLRHLPLLGGHSHRIAQAVERLRKDFHLPLRIDRIARELGMSTSGFHDHFKAITDMSPLQFQKQLRLREARRLMLGEHLDATSAGFRVGYNDASYFSRDYKKYFGTSPARDIERLRANIGGEVQEVQRSAV
ncbi:MAG: transcriptional regulator, AraC family [Chloroflexi bacterium]|jgi:AraC-like DNA-binding protein|nr:transcriptional regulator, AraC family [Chloroflexota bacterium]